MSFRKLDRVTVKLDAIETEKGFKSRLKEPHVRELAASIAKLGLLEDILVTEKTKAQPRRIVAGRDRLAALMLNDVKEHVVQVVSGTDLELRRAELEENLMRRRGDDYDAMTSELIDITAQEMQIEADRQREEEAKKEAEAAGKGKTKKAREAGKKGRKKSTRSAAMEAVAKATQRTPEAVRQSDKRHRGAEAAKTAPVKLPTDIVESWGIELTPKQVGELANVVELQDAMALSLADIKAAQRKLKEALGGKKDVVRSTAYAALSPALESLTDVFKANYKTAVCPYCCLGARRETCTGCNGVGFIGPVLLEHVPAELKKKGKAKMVLDGKGGFELLAKPAELTTERFDEVPEGL